MNFVKKYNMNKKSELILMNTIFFETCNKAKFFYLTKHLLFKKYKSYFVHIEFFQFIITYGSSFLAKILFLNENSIFLGMLLKIIRVCISCLKFKCNSKKK